MEKVTLFVAFLGAQGLSVSMIESYLAALWHFRMLIGPSRVALRFAHHIWLSFFAGSKGVKHKVHVLFDYLSVHH